MSGVLTIKPDGAAPEAEISPEQQPNRFAYYVVAHYVAGPIQGYTCREIVTAAPLVTGEQVTKVAAMIADTMKVHARGSQGGMLLDQPKTVAVIVNFQPLRAWYDPSPVPEPEDRAQGVKGNGGPQ